MRNKWFWKCVDILTVDSCRCCGNELLEGEELVCLECQMHFPLVDSAQEQTPLWQLMVGKVPFRHATTLAYYQPHDAFARLIQDAKFRGQPYTNSFLTRLLLQQLEGSGWPYDIDLIMPVPMHWLRFLKRGYNQVSPIVHTLSEVWHVPYEKRCLVRKRYVKSQLKANGEERLRNEAGTFRIRHPERLQGKHILLVDDVSTTGSTLLACADALLQVEGVSISFLTLGLTLHI
ncbi:MAG: ComF family protein [Bacteroidales bacterium]|nr:ComF family protein [Bacteroidales bacterium]